MTRLHLILPAALLVMACGDNQTHTDDRPGYGEGGSAPLSCLPNLDGQIDASELEAALGVSVSYLVSPSGKETPVDTEGAVDANGKRIWDWSIDLATDQAINLSASELGDKWYQGSFPAGQFVSAVDAGKKLEGVYAKDDEAFYLLGIASAEEAPAEGKTLLVYTSPIALYRFPIQPGIDWVSTGEIENGLIRGLPYAGKDIYEVAVDASGELVLPAYTFTQVHRVRTKVVLSPAVGDSTFTRQTSFFFECFGEVGRATSLPDELNENFTTAAEVRRLGQ